MGLDQYVYFKKKREILDTSTEDMYFRKNRHLEDFMANLWYNKNKGNDDEFNCKLLWLDKKDIEGLTKESLNDDARGFFWGSHALEDDWREIEDFKAKALKAIDDGYEVVYTSWW